jgi:hypothetical protein
LANVNEEEQGVAPLERLRKYIERLGASKKESKSGRGHAFLNGRYLALDDVSTTMFACVLVKGMLTIRLEFHPRFAERSYFTNAMASTKGPVLTLL